MPSANVNRVLLTGNLTKDPELRETSTGVSVCELRLAVNAVVKKDGNYESKPNYFQVNCWGKMGENCAQYLNKGSKVAIDGRLEWQRWESKEGQTNSRVVVVANQVEFLSPKSAAGQTEKSDEPTSDGGDDDIPF